MDFFVGFWGVRGSIPTPGHATQRYGGNTACIEVRVNDSLFILDGGSGVRTLGAALMRRSKGPIKAHMLFSHSHWDHIQGFPFFIPAYNPNTVLKVYGTKEGEENIYDLLCGQMQDKYFPVQFSDLGAQIIADHLDGGGKQIDDCVVDYFDTHHPGGSLAYSISAGGKKVVYSTDNELDQMLLNYEESLKDKHAFRRAPADLVKFCMGADLLIADGQYTEEEYVRHIHWGHPRATTLVDLCIQADIKQLAVTHHDPLQTDDKVDKKIEECRKRARVLSYNGEIFGAREGVELMLR